MYYIIKNYLNDIKNKEIFTDRENNLFLIIFLSPIFANNCDLLKLHYMEKENRYKDDLFDYEERNDILNVKNKKNQKVILTINEGDKINKTVLESQIRRLYDLNLISKINKENIIIKSLNLNIFKIIIFTLKIKKYGILIKIYWNIFFVL